MYEKPELHANSVKPKEPVAGMTERAVAELPAVEPPAAELHALDLVDSVLGD
jgi:hypothetical protein